MKLADSIKTRGLHAAVRFAPAASLDKQQRAAFLVKAYEGFDWTRHEYTEKAWRLASPQQGGDSRSHLQLTLTPDGVNFEDVFPIGPLDVYLDNLQMLMDAVGDVFGPKLMLATGATVRLTAEVTGGDARIFLGNRCMGLENRLGPLGRPVHAVGMKLLLPPIVPAPNEPPWHAEIKMESLIEDVSQIFIEVDAKWGAPSAWSLDEIVRRMRAANEFAREQVVGFLTQYESGE